MPGDQQLIYLTMLTCGIRVAAFTVIDKKACGADHFSSMLMLLVAASCLCQEHIVRIGRIVWLSLKPVTPAQMDHEGSERSDVAKFC